MKHQINLIKQIRKDQSPKDIESRGMPDLSLVSGESQASKGGPALDKWDTFLQSE